MNSIAMSAEAFTQLVTSPRTLVLIVLLLAAAVIDYRSSRIPNRLTFGGAVFGLVYNTLVPLGDAPGILWALAGLGLGLAMMLPLYALRVTGAGDVKLVAMVGAFLGTHGVFHAVFFTFVAGGIAAIAFAVWRKACRRMARNISDELQAMAFAVLVGYSPAGAATARTSIGTLPYAVSICVGTLAALVLKQLGYA